MEIPASLPFHKDLADFFKREEAELWEWFASDKYTESAYDEQRLYLLKNTYRMEREKHAELFELADTVSRKLGIEVGVQLFQMMDGQARNAGLIFQPSAVQITFSGDMVSTLSKTEMTFTLAHEMAHYLHMVRGDGHYQISDRLLDWICGELGASASYANSFRLSRLYQEIFADRIGQYCAQDLDASISTLVRTTTGLQEVSAQAYLAQADEALSHENQKGSEQYSHPETFIRARALADWNEAPDLADKKLVRLVEGQKELEALDVLGQVDFAKLTERFIKAFLNRPWLDAENLEAHARGYFYTYQYQPEKLATTEELALLKQALESEDTGGLAESFLDYFSFILLDFVTVDPDLEDAPLLEAIKFTQQIGLAKPFDVHLAKELKLTKKKVTSLRNNWEKGAQQ